MEDVHQSYLRDLVSWLRKRAEEARDEPPSADADGFQKGRAMAYVEVLGFMQSQADVFLLNREEVNLHDFEAYSLLSGSTDEEESPNRE